KRHIEKDPALTRRFQVVKVEEPGETKCILMMRAVMVPFEKHHKVQVLDEAIDAAVRLSHRYIAGRQLPDKAVSLIDTAAARVAVSQHAVPPEVDDCRRRIQGMDTELEILGRETATGLDHQSRLAEINQVLIKEKKALVGLEKHWNEEKERVEKILDLRAKLRAAGVAPDDALKEVTGDEVLVRRPRSSPATPHSSPVSPSGNGQLTPAERDQFLAELKQLQEQ